MLRRVYAASVETTTLVLQILFEVVRTLIGYFSKKKDD